MFCRQQSVAANRLASGKQRMCKLDQASTRERLRQQDVEEGDNTCQSLIQVELRLQLAGGNRRKGLCGLRQHLGQQSPPLCLSCLRLLQPAICVHRSVTSRPSQDPGQALHRSRFASADAAGVRHRSAGTRASQRPLCEAACSHCTGLVRHADGGFADHHGLVLFKEGRLLTEHVMPCAHSHH